MKLKTLLKLKKHSVLGIALGGILLLAFFAKDLYQYFGLSKEKASPALQVQTIRVKEASMPEWVETIGALTAEKELKLKAVGAGRIQQLFVESGTWVKSGTLLANIVAAPELRAPFDGYLTDWLVKAGEYVTPGMELIELVNTDILSLTYKVPESYAGRLEIAQPVEVSVRAFPNKTFQGFVQFISPVVDRKTYTILIKATVKNPDQNLWPGMSAHVKHILATHPNALVIPEACLVLTMEGYEVLVVTQDTIQKRKIEIGERNRGRVHVTAGLSLGEAVIMTRNNSVMEGTQAVAKEWTGDW